MTRREKGDIVKETMAKGWNIMKKLSALLLIAAMLLTLAACGSNPSAPSTAPETQETAPVTEAPTETAQTEAPTEVPVVTAKPLYGEILDGYFDALLQGFGPQEYMDRGLNYLVGMVADVNKVGYAMDDVDGDGVSELMIGSVEDGMIYAMYTVKDGQETQIIDAMERSTYQLTSDGLILNRGTNGAASYGYNLYRLENGSLQFQDALVFDAAKDEKNPWFYTKNSEWAQDALESVDTEVGETTEQNLLDSTVKISFIPFSQYTA